MPPAARPPLPPREEPRHAHVEASHRRPGHHPASRHASGRAGRACAGAPATACSACAMPASRSCRRRCAALAHPLDQISARWLKKTPSPYIGEIDRIAAIAGRPGVWFVNACYEWGCTTRIDVEPAPMLAARSTGRSRARPPCRGGDAGRRRRALRQRDLAGRHRRAHRRGAGPLRRGHQPGAHVPARQIAGLAARRLHAQRHRHLAAKRSLAGRASAAPRLRQRAKPTTKRWRF